MGNVRRIVVFVALLATGLATAEGQSFVGDSPKSEVRAVWLTTLSGLDWPRTRCDGTAESIARQQEELTTLLDKLQAAGINMVLLQTRLRGTTLYPSSYEPWDACLTGTTGRSPGYDPLAFAIAECHRRGMELHAWIVALPVGSWQSAGCVALRKKYPTMVKKVGRDGFLSPESPSTADYLAMLCEELTRRYDIDGIHLDYIRYPETWRRTVSPSVARDNITAIVRRVHDKVKGQKAWVRVSCAVLGKYASLPQRSSKGWDAYNRVYQDVRRWQREGLVDMLFPMLYFRGDDFYPFALDWQQHAGGTTIVPGIGIYFLSPHEKNWPLRTITQQLAVLRQKGMGFALFRARFLVDDTKGLYSFLARSFDTTPALVPAAERGTAPSPPTALALDSAAHTLSWQGGEGYTYNIYSSRQHPVDIADARNIVAVRRQTTTAPVPTNGMYYAVTAMDRYGRESTAVQQKGPTPPTPSAATTMTGMVPLLPCDGQYVSLTSPLNGSAVLLPCDGQYVSLTASLNGGDVLQIEDMAGKVVRTLLPAAMLPVGTLDDGMYVVRSIGSRGISHRLGIFLLRRPRP